jgi:hypothetical protein
VRDIAELERGGLPGVFVATVEFRRAAEAQSTSLGFDPMRVFVPHPVGNRTDAELRQIVDDVFDELLAALVARRTE